MRGDLQPADQVVLRDEQYAVVRPCLDRLGPAEVHSADQRVLALARERLGISGQEVGRVWLNLLPAQIWCYSEGPRHEAAGGQHEPDCSNARYRTIWISDVHLGTRGCKAEFLLDFLRHNDAATIYLVGDIIDGWR